MKFPSARTLKLSDTSTVSYTESGNLIISTDFDLVTLDVREAWSLLDFLSIHREALWQVLYHGTQAKHDPEHP